MTWPVTMPLLTVNAKATVLPGGAVPKNFTIHLMPSVGTLIHESDSIIRRPIVLDAVEDTGIITGEEIPWLNHADLSPSNIHYRMTRYVNGQKCEATFVWEPTGVEAGGVVDLDTVVPLTGDPGTPVAVGPPPDLTIGTVTTLATGVAATAVITGTTPDLVLGLGIPRGSTVAVGTVTTGAPGSSAGVTNAGTVADVVLDLTIPRGDTGAAATVAVGAVTTGAAGSSAVVANGGTSGAAVLDFTIPRGDVGEVPEARTITAGTGLTGGGDLSANRTLDRSDFIATTTVTTAAAVGTWTVDPATDIFTCSQAHGITDTTAVIVEPATGAIPAGLSAISAATLPQVHEKAIYLAKVINATTLTLYTVVGTYTPVDATDAGTAGWTVRPYSTAVITITGLSLTAVGDAIEVTVRGARIREGTGTGGVGMRFNGVTTGTKYFTPFLAAYMLGTSKMLPIYSELAGSRFSLGILIFRITKTDANNVSVVPLMSQNYAMLTNDFAAFTAQTQVLYSARMEDTAGLNVTSVTFTPFERSFLEGTVVTVRRA